MSIRNLPVSPALGFHTCTRVLCFWHGWSGPEFGSLSLTDWATSPSPLNYLMISVLTWLIASVCLASEVLKKMVFSYCQYFFFTQSSTDTTLTFAESVPWLYPPCDGHFCSVWTFYGFWSKHSLWHSEFLCRIICWKIHRDVWSTSSASVLHVSCLSVPLNFTVTREWTVVELWVFTKFFLYFFFFCSF